MLDINILLIINLGIIGNFSIDFQICIIFFQERAHIDF